MIIIIVVVIIIIIIIVLSLFDCHAGEAVSHGG